MGNINGGLLYPLHVYLCTFSSPHPTLPRNIYRRIRFCLALLRCQMCHTLCCSRVRESRLATSLCLACQDLLSSRRPDRRCPVSRKPRSHLSICSSVFLGPAKTRNPRRRHYTGRCSGPRQC